MNNILKRDLEYILLRNLSKRFQHILYNDTYVSLHNTHSRINTGVIDAAISNINESITTQQNNYRKQVISILDNLFIALSSSRFDYIDLIKIIMEYIPFDFKIIYCREYSHNPGRSDMENLGYIEIENTYNCTCDNYVNFYKFIDNIRVEIESFSSGAVYNKWCQKKIRWCCNKKND